MQSKGHRCRKAILIAIDLGVVMPGLTALADGTISSGDAVFSFTNTTNAANQPNADFRPQGGATTDHLVQYWWWYRVRSGPSPDTHETALPAPSSESYVGDTAILTWNNLGHEGAHFDVVLTATVSAGPTVGSGRVSGSVKVHNNESTTLAVSLFMYADFDVGGTPLGDTESMTGPESEYLLVVDGSQFAEFYRGNFSVGCKFGSGLNGAADLLALLNDDSATTIFAIDSTPLSGDVAGVVQYDFSLPPGSELTDSASFSANMLVGPHCITFYCPGDMNDDHHTNAGDIQQFVNCMGSNALYEPDCMCIDVNQDGIFAQDDITAFVDMLLGRRFINPGCR